MNEEPKCKKHGKRETPLREDATLNGSMGFQEGVVKRDQDFLFMRLHTTCGQVRLGLGVLAPSRCCVDRSPHCSIPACTSGFGTRVHRAFPEKHSCQIYQKPLCPPSSLLPGELG